MLSLFAMPTIRDLRRGGFSFSEIGTLMGTSKERAWQIYYGWQPLRNKCKMGHCKSRQKAGGYCKKHEWKR